MEHHLESLTINDTPIDFYKAVIIGRTIVITYHYEFHSKFFELYKANKPHDGLAKTTDGQTFKFKCNVIIDGLPLVPKDVINIDITTPRSKWC